MTIDIFKHFINYQRKQPIKNPKDEFYFDKSYCHFICHYTTIELIPDVVLSNYQTALNDNRYLKEQYPNIADKFWLFAHSGCGDEWFLNKNNHQVFYYDHEQGEYELGKFVDMAVGFDEFIKLILTIQTFETQIENGEIVEPNHYFAENIYLKNPIFFDKYPYQIF